jgi:hypothetical protein
MLTTTRQWSRKRNGKSGFFWSLVRTELFYMSLFICWLHTLINEIPGLELRMACQDFLMLASKGFRAMRMCRTTKLSPDSRPLRTLRQNERCCRLPERVQDVRDWSLIVSYVDSMSFDGVFEFVDIKTRKIDTRASHNVLTTRYHYRGSCSSQQCYYAYYEFKQAIGSSFKSIYRVSVLVAGATLTPSTAKETKIDITKFA